MATNKINIASFAKFTFLVWVKSIPTILIGLLLYNTTSMNSWGTGLEIIYGAVLITFLAFLYTTPLAILMLVVVYFINRTNWPIVQQKFVIFGAYTLPILVLFGFVGSVSSDMVLFTLFILAIPAAMIYFTTLLPSNKHLIDDAERDDIIDDISFDE